MVMDVSRKCSPSSNEREDTKACNEKGLKLFGVRILREGEEEVIRKSSSMGNLTSYIALEQSNGDHGYLSDGLVQSSRRGRHMRKRGVPWTKDEHKTFLEGLKKLGKGDWRGISRNFVTTRTPTQVASHAQKYFLRQTTPSTKKRRSSLFDVVINDTAKNFKISPTLPMTGTQEAPEEINLLYHEKHSGQTSAENETQVAGQSWEASLTLPSTKCGQVSNFHGVSYMEEISNGMTNQSSTGHPLVLPNISLIPALHLSYRMDTIAPKLHDYAPYPPDLLQLSFNPLTQSNPSALSLSIETRNLELTIAPPQPLEAIKNSSGTSNFMPTIQVI